MESQLNTIPPNFQAPVLHGKYSSTLATQMKTNIQRAWRNVLRQKADLRPRFMRNVFMSVLLGTTYLQLSNDQAGLFSRFSAFFFVMIIKLLEQIHMQEQYFTETKQQEHMQKSAIK
eukprot:TRINITY_DN3834_c0_g1_i2.p1 TRINITY_DN3834_c0_g1~~TRINITY_DN3834_c0_g1_i2.p1  ORF type:complete len:117 (-),score=27.65 TRINITY_DN3834_c0_g1_i2:442-792(-)